MKWMPDVNGIHFLTDAEGNQLAWYSSFFLRNIVRNFHVIEFRKHFFLLLTQIRQAMILAFQPQTWLWGDGIATVL